MDKIKEQNQNINQQISQQEDSVPNQQRIEIEENKKKEQIEEKKSKIQQLVDLVNYTKLQDENKEYYQKLTDTIKEVIQQKKKVKIEQQGYTYCSQCNQQFTKEEMDNLSDIVQNSCRHFSHKTCIFTQFLEHYYDKQILKQNLKCKSIYDDSCQQEIFDDDLIDDVWGLELFEEQVRIRKSTKEKCCICQEEHEKECKENNNQQDFIEYTSCQKQEKGKHRFYTQCLENLLKLKLQNIVNLQNMENIDNFLKYKESFNCPGCLNDYQKDFNNMELYNNNINDIESAFLQIKNNKIRKIQQIKNDKQNIIDRRHKKNLNQYGNIKEEEKNILKDYYGKISLQIQEMYLQQEKEVNTQYDENITLLKDVLRFFRQNYFEKRDKIVYYNEKPDQDNFLNQEFIKLTLKDDNIYYQQKQDEDDGDLLQFNPIQIKNQDIDESKIVNKENQVDQCPKCQNYIINKKKLPKINCSYCQIEFCNICQLYKTNNQNNLTELDKIQIQEQQKCTCSQFCQQNQKNKELIFGSCCICHQKMSQITYQGNSVQFWCDKCYNAQERLLKQ